MARTCDMLIVGGGVMGLAIAQTLAKRAVGKVIVLEKSFIGAGSSGKSGAIIRQHYSNALTARMAQWSLGVYARFDELYGGPPVFTRTGMVVVVKEQDRAGLEANLALQNELGIVTRLVSAPELADIDPNVHLAADEVAAWEPDAGYVEAVQVLDTWAQSARQLGAEICEGVEVTGIVIEKDRVVGVDTNEGRYQCGKLILAAGPWAARLGKMLQLDLPVQPCRTQVALYRKPPNYARRVAVYGDFALGIYFKPTHGDIVHAGSIGGEEIKDVVDPDSYNEAADSAFLGRVRQLLSRRYPGMHRCYGRGGFGALYAITPDWHPILDALPGIEGVYAAVGFSGHGFKMAPIVGQLLAEMIVDGSARTLDPGPLRFSRFAEQDPVKIPHNYSVMG
ncbi:MAG TPA: FAD-binding oxidoreductase [Gemmatales bacterium]|nr:FAD-binding oxidoreductase [Gemmatales bacterium]HMP60720.1 FAD-binding oxidoreductase [Gemmatales bacterium]